MKNSIICGCALLVGFSASAFADNENIYCGKGSESYSVDHAAMALVVEDGHGKLFFEGKDVSKDYDISKTNDGFQALEKSSSRNNPGPSIAFKSCGEDNTAYAHFIGGMVSNQPFSCTCERE